MRCVLKCQKQITRHAHINIELIKINFLKKLKGYRKYKKKSCGQKAYFRICWSPRSENWKYDFFYIVLYLHYGCTPHTSKNRKNAKMTQNDKHFTYFGGRMMCIFHRKSKSFKTPLENPWELPIPDLWPLGWSGVIERSYEGPICYPFLAILYVLPNDCISDVRIQDYNSGCFLWVY